MKAPDFRVSKPVYIIAAALCAAALGYGIYEFARTARELSSARSELASTTLSLQTTQGSLSAVQEENASLTDALVAAQQTNDAFSNQINSIKGTVDQLDRLSKTDPELLKKYSRVYFLNENYIPASLSNIDQKYASEKTRTYRIQSQVAPYLERLLEDAGNAASTTLLIASSYRSFQEQASLKSNYTVTYGSGANKFSADQGYSEHQLGTAVDFTAPSLGGGLVGFEKTPAYQWLLDNAYKYGFVISYPKENTYYQFEPWHWRFVGVDLATKLHDDHKFFYDLDQREIDGYLISLFD